MIRMVLLASAAVLTTVAGNPAFAQDSTQSTGGAQRGGDEITCREVTAMDTATVPGVLYFISGYSAARSDGMAGQESGSASNMNDTDVSGADAGSGAAAKSDAGGSNSSSAAGADSTTGTAAADAGSTSDATGSASDVSPASTGTSSSGSGSATADSSSGSSSASGKANPQIGMIRGYFEVPVERVVVACKNAPDSRVSDIIRQESGSGAGSGGTSAN